MYIVKPQKGFVIPVEYMVNENLFDDNVKYLRSEQKHIVNESDNTEDNSVFGGREKIVPRDVEIVDDSVNDRLFDDDEIHMSKDGNKVINAVLDERNNKIESGNGLLVFDDVIEEGIVIDDNQSIELNKARSNLRKAIEVEIEKVGKLVLDDSEAEISVKAAVKSADVEIDDRDIPAETISSGEFVKTSSIENSSESDDNK